MNSKNRMYKLQNGTETAIWAHHEIICLREQLATVKAELVSVTNELNGAKSDGIREAISDSGIEINSRGYKTCDYEMLIDYADQIKQTNNESGEG